MSLRSKILKGSVVLTAGQAVGYGAALARNIILARLLDKQDYAIVTLLDIMISAFDLASKASIGQQIVQSKDGDKPAFQATAQACQFMAGCAGSLLMAAAAVPVAHFFKVPDLWWVFMLVSMIGLFRGLEHFDPTREIRSLNYIPSALVDALPQVIITVLALPLAWWLRDYRVIVMLVLSRSALALAMTHILAKQPYRWKLDKAFTRQVFMFGWPLVANAWLMFGLQQGDQVLIGAQYSKSDLAQYFAAVQLALAPGYMLLQVLISVMLPVFSQVQDNLKEFRNRYILCTEFATVVGASLACFVTLAGELVIVTVFGNKYAGGGAIMGWLATANAFRIIRGISILASMARGDTKTNMFANVFRLGGLGLAAYAVYAGADLKWVAACGLFGEIIALGCTNYRLHQLHGISFVESTRPALVAGAVIGLSGIVASTGMHRFSLPVLIGICVLAYAAALLAMWRSFGELRRHGLELFGASPFANVFRFLTRWGGA